MTINGVFTSFVAVILLCNSLFLGKRIRYELLRYRERKEERMQISTDGSFVGIDVAGNLVRPRLDPDGHLERGGYIIVFVVHSATLAGDVSFWNRAIELTSSSLSNGAGAIQYWGVCDCGMACQSLQEIAKFNLLGYMDPYQMHALARADKAKAALLYDRTLTLKAELPLGPDPVTESNVLHREAR